MNKWLDLQSSYVINMMPASRLNDLPFPTDKKKKKTRRTTARQYEQLKIKGNKSAFFTQL